MSEISDSTEPCRVQLSRRKGWRMPPNTVIVSRPSKWGNRHDYRVVGRNLAVRLYAKDLAPGGLGLGPINAILTADDVRRELAGKNLGEMTEDQGVAFGPGAREPNPQAGSALRASPPNADSYRGWRISYDPPPIPVRCFDWTATHPDFDASWEGEEDGWVGNGLRSALEAVRV